VAPGLPSFLWTREANGVTGVEECRCVRKQGRGRSVRPTNLSEPTEIASTFERCAGCWRWLRAVTTPGCRSLAAVMDLFSRKIVGWSTRPTIARELVLDAVLMAVRRRRPRGTIIHSDQGSQYGSDDWRRFCKTNHLEPSMSRRANCWDNAVAESFFSSLKMECIKKKIYRTRELHRPRYLATLILSTIQRAAIVI